MMTLGELNKSANKTAKSANKMDAKLANKTAKSYNPSTLSTTTNERL